MSDLQNRIAALLGTEPVLRFGYAPVRPTERWQHRFTATRVQWVDVTVFNDCDDAYEEARAEALSLGDDAWSNDGDLEELVCQDSRLLNADVVAAWDDEYDGHYNPATGAPYCYNCGDLLADPQPEHVDGDQYCAVCYEDRG